MRGRGERGSCGPRTTSTVGAFFFLGRIGGLDQIPADIDGVGGVVYVGSVDIAYDDGVCTAQGLEVELFALCDDLVTPEHSTSGCQEE